MEDVGARQNLEWIVESSRVLKNRRLGPTKTFCFFATIFLFILDELVWPAARFGTIGQSSDRRRLEVCNPLLRVVAT